MNTLLFIFYYELRWYLRMNSWGKIVRRRRKKSFFIGEKEQYSVETVANVFENVSLVSFFSLRFDK